MKAASNRLRVALVTPRFAPEMGGVERHVEEVARRLGDDLDVTVLCTDRSGLLPGVEQCDGFTVRRVRAWPARRDYYFAPQIFSHLVDHPWDLIHVQSYHTVVAPTAMLAALRRRTPYVVTFHGGGHSAALRRSLRRPQRLLLRPLLARASRLVAIARFEVEVYGHELRIPAERFVFIPNGGDLQLPEQLPPTVNGLIASVGRLERFKGHHRVIAAMPKVIEGRPDAALCITGSGPYESALRRQAEKLGVADRVRIEAAPAADRKAMAERLASAALVVLLSDFETHPLVAMEALALGRPLLVADNSGLRELAEDGLARAIPTESKPQTVADAILQQLNHPQPRRQVSLPTWDDCAAALLDLYREVARDHACAS